MKRFFKIYLSIFLVSLFLAFFLSFSFINIFYEFELVSDKILLYTSCVISIVFALICVFIAGYINKTEKKTKIGHWLNLNMAKLVLGYILLVISFYSIKPKVFLPISDMKELINLEWCILGVAITVFLIWHVIIIEYLEKKKPTIPQEETPIKKALCLQEKEEFYFDATMLLNNSYLLCINLIALSFATGYIYITSRIANIFSQSMVIIVLFLCTNTIIGLLFDIVKLFNEKKRVMLRDTVTTNKDVVIQNVIAKEAKSTLMTIETIEKLESISEDEKNRMTKEIAEKFFETYGVVSEGESLNAGDNNDQL